MGSSESAGQWPVEPRPFVFIGEKDGEAKTVHQVYAPTRAMAVACASVISIMLRDEDELAE